MPQVPRLTGPTVEERALPGNRVPMEGPGIEAFGGGKQIASAIQSAGGIAEDVYKDVAKNQIMEADSKLMNVEQDLLSNPEYGALNLKGEQAFKAPEEVSKAYDENIKKIEETITNPMARNAFKRMALEKKQAIQKSVGNHVGKEIENYNVQVSKTYEASKLNYALHNYNNPEIVKSSIEDVFVAMDESPAYRGLPQQTKDLMKLEYASQVHRSVIDRMVDNGEDLAAQSYFDSNKGQIAGKDLANIEKALEISSTLGFAQREADKIMSSTGSMTQAYELAKQVEDPKKRQALTDEISRQFTIKKNAEREDREEGHRYVKNLLEQNGGNLNDPKIQRALTGFSASQHSALKEYAKNIVEGKDVVTDKQVYYDLMTLGSDPQTKDDFAKLDLMDPKYVKSLGKQDWEEMVKMQKTVRAGKTEPKFKAFRTEEQILNDVVLEAKINPKSKDFGRLKNKYFDQLVEFRETYKKEPTEQDKKAIADQLIIQGITDKGVFFDTKKRAYQLEDDETFVEIPGAAKQKKTETASARPKTVKQNGVTFKLNEKTGKYERQ